ncbi:MAG: hypothetical protein EOM53_05750, partial [Alphaproteobacteria bacterium]|nr:hypothetical protein [Alphaproteobacteria bacterium]
MFNPEDVQKLERIAEKINLINEITNDFGSIQSALKDKKSGKTQQVQKEKTYPVERGKDYNGFYICQSVQ